MQRICVFAGSNPGKDAIYSGIVEQLGKVLVKQNLHLVYDGSNKGMMGHLADTVLKHKGKAIGIMPKKLFQVDFFHRGLTQLIQVKDMRERKSKMEKLSDAFIALPGGFGTLEEIFEAVSWRQLGIHQKPVGVLNINGFYDPLKSMIDRAEREGFISEVHRDLIIFDNDPTALVQKLINSCHSAKRKNYERISAYQ